MINETGWINIAKVGVWTDMNGNRVDLTPERLDAIVTGYQPTDREAALVFGHPKTDDPAFGWVSALKRKGEFLQARFRKVAEAVKNVVDNGHYEKVSMSLFPDGKTLRHVGLLGATQPAIPGLGNVRFEAGEDEIVIEFSLDSTHDGPDERKEDDMSEELKKQLEEEGRKRREAEDKLKQTKTELAAANEGKQTAEAKLTELQSGQRGKDVETRIDKLISENRILPADKPAVQAVALALADSGQEIELAAGSGKKNLTDHLFDFLGALPDRKMLKEFAQPDGDGDNEKYDPELTQHV